MFCVECGQEGHIFRNGLCIGCYIKSHSFSNGPKIIDLVRCPHCGSYRYKNSWLSGDFKEIIQHIIKNSFYVNKELKKTGMSIECNETDETTTCKVIVSGFLDGIPVSEKHMLNIRLKKMVCDVCSRRFGGYYEAVLQIRANKRKLSEDELKMIRSMIEGFVENLRIKGNRGLFITDTDMRHGGVDFYLSESKPAQTIAKKIYEHFGGEIKQSSKNIGMKNGRQIYRMTYLIRLPSYQKNCFISLNNSFFLILSISRNKIRVVELSSWKETIFDSKTLQKATVMGHEKLIKNAIVVSQSKDEIQIMDPDTYKVVYVRKPQPMFFDSDKVKIVKLDDHIFLFPEKTKLF
ncbi:hypothetical protein B6U70_02460 [Euryarchaeota archaeon ex4484_162]|nr:MAG: hypothetical protein B6U70_02460 [Euryarchaeota archaeon ex4484_162]